MSLVSLPRDIVANLLLPRLEVYHQVQLRRVSKCLKEQVDSLYSHYLPRYALELRMNSVRQHRWTLYQRTQTIEMEKSERMQKILFSLPGYKRLVEKKNWAEQSYSLLRKRKLFEME